MRARVKFANTPKSDKEPRVLHVVTDDTGKEHEVWATDPLDAIQQITALIKQQCANPPST